VCAEACVASACVHRQTAGRAGWDFPATAAATPPHRVVFHDTLEASNTSAALWDSWSTEAIFSATCGAGVGHYALRFRGAPARQLVSRPVDVRYGGVWRFSLIYGTGTPGCADMATGLVHLAYSLDAPDDATTGALNASANATWTSIRAFAREDFRRPPGSFVEAEVTLPRRAWSTATRFKFTSPSTLRSLTAGPSTMCD
jgi:hypothetical protein